MVFEKTKRDRKREQARAAVENTPKAIYKKARREHLREVTRLLREAYREILQIRRAKLTYRIEK